MKNNKIILVLIALTIIFTFLGSTLAYFNWQTSEEQRTNVVFTLEQDFSCAADGGGDITSNEVAIAPTSCTNSDHAIMREITVTPNILRDNLEIGMDLWINIDFIDQAFSDSQNLKYALTTSQHNCVNGVVSSGSFNALSAGDQVPILRKTFSTSTPETYYLWVWLDAKETSRSTMQKNFEFSIGGSCTDTPRDNKFYAVYSADDGSLRFYQEEENVIEVGSTYRERTVTAVYKIYETDIYSNSNYPPWYKHRDVITNIVVEDPISPQEDPISPQEDPISPQEDPISPQNTQYWFHSLTKVESIDVSKLDTSKVTSMRAMFNHAGQEASEFTIIGLEGFNTSNVVAMTYMFNYAGEGATKFDIGDLSGWDTSNVTDMSGMFYYAGYNSNSIDLGNLSEWDVSNVTDMSQMFWGLGSEAQSWSVGDLSGWDTSNVNNMRGMFRNIAYNATTLNFGKLDTWKTSRVTDMGSMFARTGVNATNLDIGDIGEWDTSKVTNMSGMFREFGTNSQSWKIGNLGKWDVSNVTDMNKMFYLAGKAATDWNIGDIGGKDDIKGWDTSKVTNMSQMFLGAGTKSNLTLDLSGWNVNNVTNYDEFVTTEYGTTLNIEEPKWVN